MADLPINPLLQNLDGQLLEAAGEKASQNAELMFMHLRDARELLRNSREDRIIAKAAMVISCAALEANLAHFTSIGEHFQNVRPGTYGTPQLEYLRGIESFVDENGDVRTRKMKQSLEDRM